jgi:hypothetical protein
LPLFWIGFGVSVVLGINQLVCDCCSVGLLFCEGLVFQDFWVFLAFVLATACCCFNFLLCFLLLHALVIS